MLQHKELYLLFLLVTLAFSTFAGNLSTNISGNDTVKTGITEDETILFNMINDMRRQNKLTSIPLSLNLCKVAQTHIADLIKWKPQEKGCSLHSWSGSGKWTSCCNTKEVFGIQCMKSKPREITGYLGDGYELIYWGEDNATPAEAADLWKQVGASSDMILSQAKWSGYQWQAIGVGIKSGYAVLWLGDAEDKNTEVTSFANNTVAQQAVAKSAVDEKTPAAEKEIIKPKPTEKPKEIVVSKQDVKQPTKVSGTKYYLIVSSLKTIEAANKELETIKLKGYPAAIVLQGESSFRIAIASFDTAEKASSLKNSLKDTFPGIWIFKK
jgi:hypothetical protein